MKRIGEPIALLDHVVSLGSKQAAKTKTATTATTRRFMPHTAIEIGSDLSNAMDDYRRGISHRQSRSVQLVNLLTGIRANPGCAQMVAVQVGGSVPI
jgi:hypothetical protein